MRVAFRHLALRARHRRAVPLAQAAEAAARQGAFWPLHDALYADQGRLDDPHLWARCEPLGLDVERFDADRREPAAAERVARDVRDGAARRSDGDADAVWTAMAVNGVIATMASVRNSRRYERLGPPTEGRARKGSPI